MVGSELSTQIGEHRLTHCFYIAVHCREHGEVRIGTQHKPATRRHPCPMCSARCEYSVLGEGGTLRPLPFWDRPQDVYSFFESNHRDLTSRLPARVPH